MQNETYKFDHEVFGKLEVVMYEDKPYFIANNVSDILGYKQHKDGRAHCKSLIKLSLPDLRKLDLVLLATNPQGIILCPEKDVYRMIMRSNLPKAEEFQDWVMEEVLPTIRKTGGMVSDVDQMVNTFFGSCSDEVKIVAKGLLTTVKENQHKVDFFEAVSNSEDCIDVGQFAKLLGTGRTRLFNALREEGFLMKGSTLPYGRYRTETKWFKVIETTKRGRIYTKTLITPKGQIELEKRLRGKLDLAA